MQRDKIAADRDGLYAANTTLNRELRARAAELADARASLTQCVAAGVDWAEVQRVLDRYGVTRIERDASRWIARYGVGSSTPGATLAKVMANVQGGAE
jgi:hypothetical protein